MAAQSDELLVEILRLLTRAVSPHLDLEDKRRLAELIVQLQLAHQSSRNDHR